MGDDLEAGGPPDSDNGSPPDEEANEELVSLEAEEEALTVPETIALGEFELRAHTARQILWLFTIANLVILVFILALFVTDVLMITGDRITPDERLITSEVVMTLLGATTVQVGSIMLTIAAYLFPKKKPG